MTFSQCVILATSFCWFLMRKKLTSTETFCDKTANAILHPHKQLWLTCWKCTNSAPLSHNNIYLVKCKHNLQHNKSIICIQFIHLTRAQCTMVVNLSTTNYYRQFVFAVNCVTAYANVLVENKKHALSSALGDKLRAHVHKHKDINKPSDYAMKTTRN